MTFDLRMRTSRMGDNVVELRRPDPEREMSEAGGVPYDRFLIDEGLELLATYRSIPDPDLRRTVLRLVHDLADMFDADGRSN